MKLEILNHKGKDIVYINFSYGNVLDKKQAVLDLIEEAKSYIATHPPNSLLTITDVTGLRFSTELINAFSDFASQNHPFVKAAAVVGVTGIQKIAYDTIMKLTKRTIPMFPSVEEAMDWLVEQ